MVKRRSIVAGLLSSLALLLASPALASEPGPTPTGGSGHREPARVYTNADLERFGPAPDHPTPTTDAAGWDFVTEFLDRAYERLDADRAHDLERMRAEAESEALTPRHDHGHLPISPYYGRSWKRHGGPGCSRPGHGPFSGPYSQSSVSYGIVPLHARPTLAMRHRARAIQNSGAAAVPRR